MWSTAVWNCTSKKNIWNNVRRLRSALPSASVPTLPLSILIARAARMAERVDGELVVVYVDVGADDSPENRRTLADNIRFAEHLGGKVITATGKNVAEEMAKIVRERHITQVIFGRSALKGWRKYLYWSAIHRFLRDAPPVDVHIVTQEAR